MSGAIEDALGPDPSIPEMAERSLFFAKRCTKLWQICAVLVYLHPLRRRSRWGTSSQAVFGGRRDDESSLSYWDRQRGALAPFWVFSVPLPPSPHPVPEAGLGDARG